MAKGYSVSAYVLKMIGYTEKLSQLNSVMDRELSIDLIFDRLLFTLYYEFEHKKTRVHTL